MDDPNFGDSLTRRQFVLAGGAAAVVALLPEASLGATAVRGRIPTLQTWAAEDRAEVTVLSAEELHFEIAEGSGQIRLCQRQDLPDQKRFLYHLSLTGLSWDSYSTLRALDHRGQIQDERRLKGLNPSLTRPRIAVMSCSSVSHLKKQARMWREVPEVHPDLIFFSGDIVYANSKISSITREPEKVPRALGRYVQTWESVDLYRFETLIPLLAVWDDHDYGMNNGDSTHPYKQEMQEVFRSFYPLPESDPLLKTGEGVSFRAHFFGTDFYFLDDRSFAVPQETMWGKSQEAWLGDDYTNRPFPAWIVNGVCFFKYTRWIESVEKFARPSIEKFQELIRRQGKPCLLVSGDIHATQVQKIPKEIFGFETYELTSSAMHSTDARFIHRRSPEDGQLLYEGSQNFLFLDLSLEPDRMILEVTCVTPGERRPLGASVEISGSLA